MTKTEISERRQNAKFERERERIKCNEVGN